MTHGRKPPTAPDGAETAPDGLAARDTEHALLEDLHVLLESLDDDPDRLENETSRLQTIHGDAVYVELIHLLSHLRFSQSEAEPLWTRILEHRSNMERRLRSPVDLRVALVSYFLEINRHLKNPKIIEMQLFERQRDSAYRDDLTGLYNFRMFREYLSRETFVSERRAQPLSLVMLDVDHFKQYNDGAGHEAGNDCLRTLARLLNREMRRSDIAARYGGEEFALILPCTPKTNAQAIAERTRRAVEAHRFDDEAVLPGGRLTVSAGVATFPADAGTAQDLVRHADRALYLAKAAGRNRVVLYGESRRSFGRIDIELPGTFRSLDSRSRELTTVNLSEGGILFRTDVRLQVGGLIELDLRVDADHEIVTGARVVHVERADDGTYRVAVTLSDGTGPDRSSLLALIRDRAVEPIRAADDPVPT